LKEKKVKIREAINKDGTKTIYLDCFMGYYIDFDGKKNPLLGEFFSVNCSDKQV